MRATGGRRVTTVDLYRLAEEESNGSLTREDRAELWRLAAPVAFANFEVVPSSDRSEDPIELVEYDSEWPVRFEEWRRGLAAALGPAAIAIEHVGSTSVPGLIAKPIIDIQVSVADLDAEQLYVPQIEALGVQLRSRDDEHRYFRPFADRPRDVHIHVCRAASRWEREHLAFRDRLRADADARRRYADAKLQALTDFPDDRVGYTDSKTAVILDILEGPDRPPC